MEINPVQVKTEPVDSISSICFPIPADCSQGPNQLGAAGNAVPDGMKPPLGSVASTVCQKDGQHLDFNVYLESSLQISGAVKSEYYNSDNPSKRVSSGSLNPPTSLTHPTGNPNELLTANKFQHTFHGTKETLQEMVDTTETSHLKSSSLVSPKPSEALFVRALIGRCKRIAPLWFRGVSSMRERNREENRRMASNNGQSQSDWSLIGLKIAVS
ncbi:Nuclear factor 1 A type [Fasciolopsis buskii]|uniref:Nuclear factor 1 A type n=1 Tax=Fasciolopsis buskii TaxID=27845 RepID=A0A8E0RLC5_9TREM|nr:Nuclear factor 1 A type [Fasciolopsis buski]